MNCHDISKERALNILAYGGDRPIEISEARWNAIKEQLKEFSAMLKYQKLKILQAMRGGSYASALRIASGSSELTDWFLFLKRWFE